ncbi:MAG: PASTA domain-containing protein [Fidelibacterota bacterium]
MTAIGLTFDKIIMPLYTHHGQVLDLPDVTELKFEEARYILESKGFRAMKGDEKYSSYYPPGVVIDQNPPPYSTVKRGRRVYLTVSIEEELIPVPNLIGKSERGAKIEIKRVGLLLDSIRYDYSSFPEDVVAYQSIPKGKKVKKGTPIEIVVSIGSRPDQFKVPYLIGKSLKNAEELIIKAGFKLGEIRYRVVPDLIPFTILNQSLKPGVIVSDRLKIDLIVSVTEDSKPVDIKSEL